MNKVRELKDYKSGKGVCPCETTCICSLGDRGLIFQCRLNKQWMP